MSTQNLATEEQAAQAAAGVDTPDTPAVDTPADSSPTTEDTPAVSTDPTETEDVNSILDLE